MAIAHYGYLVLKMPSPAGVLTVRGDRTAAVATVEKLHALAVEAARSEEDPSTSRARAPAKAPKVQPSDPDDVPVKTVQIGADSSLSSGQMWTCSPGNRHRCPDPQGSDRAQSENLPRRHAGAPEASEAVRGAAELHP